MLLVNCICTNMLNVAIHNCAIAVKGLLKCIFIKWMIDYLSIIKVLFDIVSRAVEANIRDNMPTARTNKEKIEYRRIRFLDVAIIRQKSNFAVFNIVLQIFAEFKGGDDTFD